MVDPSFSLCARPWAQEAPKVDTQTRKVKETPMFADTIVVPCSTGNVTVTKINQDSFGSVFRYNDATHEMKLTIRHSKTTKNGVAYDRHNVELLETIYATSTVPEYTRTMYFVIQQLPSDSGYVNADAIADWMIASTNAALVKLMNWES